MHNFLLFLINFFQTVIIFINVYLMNKYIFSQTLTFKRKMLFITGAGAIVAVIEQVISLINYSNMTVVILKAIEWLLLFILVYKGLNIKLWRSILLFVLNLFSLGISDIVAMYVVTKGLGHDEVSIITGKELLPLFVGVVLITLVQCLFVQFIKISKKIFVFRIELKDKTYKYVYLNMLLSGVTLFSIDMVLWMTKQNVYIILLFIILSGVSFYLNISSVRMVIQVDLKGEKLRMQEEYNSILNDIKHKFVGIISIISALVETNNTEGLKEYLKELDKNYLENIKSIPTNIKNSKIFYLMSNKLKAANEKGVFASVIIPYEIDVVPGIREDDFIYVLNELLSNAIEHASESEEKRIYIKIEKLSDCMKIRIENSVVQFVRDNKMAVLKGEESKVGRGNGLKQVRKLIGDKAFFKTSIKENFIVDLVIDEGK